MSRKKFKKAVRKKTSSSDQKEGVSREKESYKPEHDQRVDAGFESAQVDVLQKKRELSNVKRLEAIQKREERVGRANLYIHLDGPRAAQHIVFSSSDEETSKEEPRLDHVFPPSVEGAGDRGGREGAVRRVLFDSDDSGDVDDPELFAVRRQFQGKTGEKLFKLQQRIGVDSRFRLDERFAESEEEEEEEEEEKEEDTHDELAEQLQQEKSKALSIIDSILGSTSSTRWKSSSHKRVGNVQSVILPARYDPESSNCAELEQLSTAGEHSPHDERESMDDSEEEEEQKEDNSTPVVSGERYFSVSGDLRNMFSGQEFSFLGEEGSSQLSDCEQLLCASKHRDLDTSGTEEKLKRFKRTKFQPEDSLASPPLSISANAGLTSESVEKKSKIVSKPHNLFFFHSNNKKLVNRLDENTFYRTASLEELERRWGNRRVAMKQSARKQHRDAVRMAHKRRKL